MADPEADCPEEEKKIGWHFCPDYDGLLIGPGPAHLKMLMHQRCVCDVPKERVTF